jgi:hypothetical protein
MPMPEMAVEIAALMNLDFSLNPRYFAKCASNFCYRYSRQGKLRHIGAPTNGWATWEWIDNANPQA